MFTVYAPQQIVIWGPGNIPRNSPFSPYTINLPLLSEAERQALGWWPCIILEAPVYDKAIERLDGYSFTFDEITYYAELVVVPLNQEEIADLGRQAEATTESAAIAQARELEELRRHDSTRTTVGASQKLSAQDLVDIDTDLQAAYVSIDDPSVPLPPRVYTQNQRAKK